MRMWLSSRPVILSLISLLAFCAEAQQIKGRYIVELTTPPVTEAVAANAGISAKQSLRSSAATNHRARVRSEQAAVRSGLQSLPGVTVLDSMDTVTNALIVNTDDPDALRNIPGVAKVYPVRKVKLLLDRAVVLHRVVDAWNQLGSAGAGRGIKVGIIDTGIDNNHPGMKNSTLTAPSGYPILTRDTDRVFTNGKVIVARSYVDLLPSPDSDHSARDRVGHGTALAMIVGGVRAVGPLATITGVAPDAWIGNYKVFGSPGSNDSSTDDVIIKAVDDAVADGMDIISLSIGSDVAPRFSDDVQISVIERAAKAGVIVVVAAGNNGPDLSTVGSPATSPYAIAVGASTNDRTFGTSVAVNGLGSIPAVNRSGSMATSGQITGKLTDVSRFESSGEGCSAYPAQALANSIALIRRGTCTFEVKLQNAADAGAVGAVVTAREDSPDAITMSVTAATLPAQMISYSNGEALRAKLAQDPNQTVSMQLTLSAMAVTPGRLASYSSTGPGVDLSIKPDVTAVGSTFYTATQSFDRNGDMYNADGFVLVSGTSFSTPFVAGVAALLKAARPGLSVDQYRSLIVNTSSAMFARDGSQLGSQSGGAGLVDAFAALNSTATVLPTSVSFGAGLKEISATRRFTLTNISGSDETYSLTVEPNGCSSAPAVSQDTLAVAAGQSADVDLAWNGSGIGPGACEGIVRISGTSSGTTLRLPFWYASATGVPARITQLDITDSGRRNTTVQDAILFRLSDGAGLPIGDYNPEVSIVSGGGAIVAAHRYDKQVPGAYGIDVRLGPRAGTNTIEVRVGDVVKRFDITAR
jgi:subtilisin family serine protease